MIIIGLLRTILLLQTLTGYYASSVVRCDALSSTTCDAVLGPPDTLGVWLQPGGERVVVRMDDDFMGDITVHYDAPEGAGASLGFQDSRGNWLQANSIALYRIDDALFIKYLGDKPWRQISIRSEYRYEFKIDAVSVWGSPIRYWFLPSVVR